MKIIAYSILLILFIPNLSAHSLKERMDDRVSKLNEILTSDENPYLRLVKEGRNVVFELEALGRLFESEYKDLNYIKNEFKILEDQIGNCKKWLDLFENEVEQNEKTRFEKKLNEELKSLRLLLKKWNINKTWKKTEKIIESLDLSSEKTFRKFKSGFQNEVKFILDKKYDFTFGETGLHELRRNIRWPRIYLSIFQDKVYMEEVQCTESELYNLGLSVNKIEFSGDKTDLEISKCEYFKLTGTIEKLGQIKDELEKNDMLNDRVPKKIQEESEKIHKKLVQNILKKLIK